MNPLLAGPAAAIDRRPASVPGMPDSLVALLAARVTESPDRRAVVDGLRVADAGAAGATDAAGSPADGPSLPAAFTWAELAAAAVVLARRFEAAGLRPGDRLAHVSAHGPEWIVVDLACLLAGVVHVALHAGSDAAELRRLVAWLDPRGLALAGPDATRRWDGGDAARLLIPTAVDAADWRPLAADRSAIRAELDQRVADRDPDACCTILLSSGTTGLPHGFMHSQRSLATNAAAAAEVFLDDPRDVRLSWLPLSHAVARTGDLYTTLVRGGCLNVVRDRTRLLDACRALPPTVMLGVPVAFERLERGVRSGRIADLRQALGGGIRACVSGGAPLRRRTAECFAAAGVPLVEGYGLAEAGPVVAVANPRIARPGTVGPPLAGIDVRIDERPDSRGQLLVRTPSRACGVLAPPDAGAGGPAPDRRPADGWIETGDLAEIDDHGQVRIVGRLRETLVLASGVKLPPAEVERALAEDDAVAQVCVVGDGLPWPVAIVVPEPAVLRAALSQLGARVFSKRGAVRHPRVLAWLGRRIAARQRHLPRAWRVRRAVLVTRPFEPGSGELTESFKIVRRVIAAHHAARIAAAAEPRPAGPVCVVPNADGRRGAAAERSGAAAGAAPAGQKDSWLSAAVWNVAAGAGAGDGFALAADRAALPIDDAVAEVLARTTAAVAELRAGGRLYDPPARPPEPQPPLADPPPAPVGKFSRAAEAAVGAAGLWGLAVPAEFGGVGATVGDLARAITRLAADCPTAAGMLAVHSTIGAVSALAAFGTPEQRARHLPGLAAGQPLSVFGGTEPEAGCDLAAVRAVIERRADRLVLTGTKMFITNAVHGRLVKLLATLDGRLRVALVRLPDADTATFRLRHYALHPLRHAHNAGLQFSGFEIEAADLLDAGADRDGMAIVWHGLNRGRIGLAAQAAGTLRLLLGHARDHARRRVTWSAPIGSRQLVQGRLARIAAGIVACEALTAWAATAIDAGQSGELEALAAKITASTCVRDGAIDALGIHGGRAFLVGHPLGDALHDHFAVTVYEGESDLLGLALFKGLARRHPLACLAADPRPLRRTGGWLGWRLAVAAGAGRDATILDARLRAHARRGRRDLARVAVRIDRAIRRHGARLADLQLEVGMLAASARELVSVVAVAHHADASGQADASGDSPAIAAADVWCRLALARAAGRQPTSADLAAVAALGERVVAGTAGFPA
jgi:long-subunit acyl-CoA synthetase (AMP-forming)/alkylation response protein AidB-like acyl-CoA dehydrogenase